MFQGKSATISFANIDLTDAKLPFDGAIDFNDTSNISVKLFPESRVYRLDLTAAGQCVSGANIFSARRNDWDTSVFAQLEEVDLHGGFGSTPWTITLVQYGREQANISKTRFSQTFSLCKSGGEILQLTVPASQKTELGQRALNIFQGQTAIDHDTQPIAAAVASAIDRPRDSSQGASVASSSGVSSVRSSSLTSTRSGAPLARSNTSCTR